MARIAGNCLGLLFFHKHNYFAIIISHQKK
jgi:hypothetical protein